MQAGQHLGDVGRVRRGLLRRRVRPADGQRWQVSSKQGVPVGRSFGSRDPADRLAKLAGAIWRHVLPVLWLSNAHPLDRMPLFGVGDTTRWTNEPKTGKVKDKREGSGAS